MKKRLFAILLAASGLLLFISSVQAEDALCASVEMEISQEVTLERQAFNAKLVIHNGREYLLVTEKS